MFGRSKVIDFRNDKEFRTFSEKIKSINDIDRLLDTILLETRKVVKADGGSICLKEKVDNDPQGKEELVYQYTHNDTLKQRGVNLRRYLYTKMHLQIDDYSIAGYVANHHQSVNIKDVYQLPANAPYSFNSQFDKDNQYVTRSVLAVPIISVGGSLIGVMQFFNKKLGKDKVVNFSEHDKQVALFYADYAAHSIDVSRITRTNILRMIKLAELRDPTETGAHVNRVGAYSLEIYDEFSKVSGVSNDESDQFKDKLRIAAMLHDIGKVAIPDSILKKPDKLNAAEYATMQQHTIKGALLFESHTTALDIMSYEVALSHHERWDGRGYPNKKKDYSIPLASRVVAIADVYDALVSNRSYKNSWSDDDVRKFFEQESGKHFDPKLVISFFEVYDVIQAVRSYYT